MNQVSQVKLLLEEASFTALLQTAPFHCLRKALAMCIGSMGNMGRGPWRIQRKERHKVGPPDMLMQGL